MTADAGAVGISLKAKHFWEKVNKTTLVEEGTDGSRRGNCTIFGNETSYLPLILPYLIVNIQQTPLCELKKTKLEALKLRRSGENTSDSVKNGIYFKTMTEGE